MENVNEKKYQNLQIISYLFYMSGWATGMLTIVNAGVFISDNPRLEGAGLLSFIIPFVIGFVTTIALLAISDLIKLAIDIEFNTRNK